MTCAAANTTMQSRMIDRAMAKTLDFAGVSVVYSRKTSGGSGGVSGIIKSIIGQQRFPMADSLGSILEIEARSYVFRASDLLTLGIREPKPGDLITEADAQYIVASPDGSMQPHRWCDSARNWVRVFVKMIEDDDGGHQQQQEEGENAPS